MKQQNEAKAAKYLHQGSIPVQIPKDWVLHSVHQYWIVGAPSMLQIN